MPFLDGRDVVNIEFCCTPCRQVSYLILHLGPPENLTLFEAYVSRPPLYGRDQGASGLVRVGFLH